VNHIAPDGSYECTVEDDEGNEVDLDCEGTAFESCLVNLVCWYGDCDAETQQVSKRYSVFLFFFCFFFCFCGLSMFQFYLMCVKWGGYPSIFLTLITCVHIPILHNHPFFKKSHRVWLDSCSAMKALEPTRKKSCLHPLDSLVWKRPNFHLPMTIPMN
jgi:hypothetical protein